VRDAARGGGGGGARGEKGVGNRKRRRTRTRRRHVKKRRNKYFCKTKSQKNRKKIAALHYGHFNPLFPRIRRSLYKQY
jgi:hypothetical protein